MDLSSEYLVPTVVEETSRGERSVRHLQPASRGADHLPGAPIDDTVANLIMA